MRSPRSFDVHRVNYFIAVYVRPASSRLRFPAFLRDARIPPSARAAYPPRRRPRRNDRACGRPCRRCPACRAVRRRRNSRCRCRARRRPPPPDTTRAPACPPPNADGGITTRPARAWRRSARAWRRRRRSRRLSPDDRKRVRRDGVCRHTRGHTTAARRARPRHAPIASRDAAPRAAVPPWDALAWMPCVHPLLFVHRVDDMQPGIYILLRDDTALAELRAALHPDLLWERVAAAPSSPPLYALAYGDTRRLAEHETKQQEKTANTANADTKHARNDATLAQGAWGYRRLHWEAGMLG